jgi:hypothetical protein
MSNKSEFLIKKIKSNIQLKKKNESLISKIKNKNLSSNLRKNRQESDLIKKIKNNYKKNNLSNLSLNIKGIDSCYNVILNDENSYNPFILNSEILKVVKDQINPNYDDEKKAKSLFNWIEKNVKYDNSRKVTAYQNSEETINRKLGICGEMAFLYITMARAAGLKSKFVNVDIDCSNRKVNHACAIVNVNGKFILVDPAYHKFDIQHKKYQIIDDHNAIEEYIYWRNKN